MDSYTNTIIPAVSLIYSMSFCMAEEKKIITADDLIAYNTSLILRTKELEEHIKNLSNAFTALYNEHMEKTTLLHKIVNFQTDIINKQQNLTKDQAEFIRKYHQSSPYPVVATPWEIEEEVE